MENIIGDPGLHLVLKIDSTSAIFEGLSFNDTDKKEYTYRVVCNKKYNHCVYSSIDEALLGYLECKYCGHNSEFSMFAYRMLEMDKKRFKRGNVYGKINSI